MSLHDSPAVWDRFNALCRLVTAQGRGITLPQLGGCHAIAQELGGPSGDGEKLAELARGVGVRIEDVEALRQSGRGGADR